MFRYSNGKARCFKKKLKFYKDYLEADELAQQNALIRFYFKVNPDKLSDSEFCERWEELMFVLKFNGTIQDKNGK